MKNESDISFLPMNQQLIWILLIDEEFSLLEISEILMSETMNIRKSLNNIRLQMDLIYGTGTKQWKKDFVFETEYLKRMFSKIEKDTTINN